MVCSRSWYRVRLRCWRSSWVNLMPLVSLVMTGSRTAHTRVRQLSSPGNRPITLVRRLTSPSDRSSRFVLRHLSVPGGVAQVHDERVQVVGEALGRGDVAGVVELVDQRLELLLGVASVDGLVERLPVRLTNPFAFALGHLRVEVARTMHAAALAVRGRPALL